jgi:hypothetical protein
MLSGLVETRVFVALSALRFFTTLAILNLVWEVAQLPFYTIWQGGTWREIIFATLHCTVGDVLIALFCGGAALVAAERRWPMDTRKRLIFMSYFIAFGLAYTVFSEWLNVTVRKSWAYSGLMPVIPPLDTGLFPVLQWIVVPILASRLIQRKLTLNSQPPVRSI